MLDESLSHRKTSDNTMDGRGKWYFFASSFMEVLVKKLEDS